MYPCKREHCQKKCSRHQKKCTKGDIVADSKKKQKCLECPKCKKMARVWNLEHHLKQDSCAAKKQKVVYKCSLAICHKTFTTPWKLDRHHGSHMVRCEGCSQAFVRLDKFSLRKQICTYSNEIDETFHSSMNANDVAVNEIDTVDPVCVMKTIMGSLVTQKT